MFFRIINNLVATNNQATTMLVLGIVFILLGLILEIIFFIFCRSFANPEQKNRLTSQMPDRWKINWRQLGAYAVLIIGIICLLTGIVFLTDYN